MYILSNHFSLSTVGVAEGARVDSTHTTTGPVQLRIDKWLSKLDQQISLEIQRYMSLH
jgi:hypothetical protein